MRNKIGTMFLASAVVLAFIGGSYAMWSETITMQGTVHTATFGIEWSYVPGSAWDTEDPLKDVSHAEASISTDGNTLTIEIFNAYPCIEYHIPFDIHSTGIVPVHFDNGFIVNPEAWITAGVISIVPTEESGPIIDAQLHFDQAWYGELIFHFDNEDGFAQGTTYTFTVTIMGHQYNEEL